MNFDLNAGLASLERTPGAIDGLLRGTPESWHNANEGPETWSARDVVGHYIYGEEANWVVRSRVILEHGEDRPFEPFDRFAQFARFGDWSMDRLLDRFAEARQKNVEIVRGWNLSDADLARTGVHPEFGPVALRQLLATWVVHDFSHLAQISRVMAKFLREDVGPWHAYLSVLKR
jgi:hypothetical protein